MSNTSRINFLTSTTAPDSLRMVCYDLDLTGSCAQQRPVLRRCSAHHVYVGASSGGIYSVLAAGLSPAVSIQGSKCDPVSQAETQAETHSVCWSRSATPYKE